MDAAGHDLAPLQNQDLVRVEDGGDPLGDNETGPPFHQPFQRLLDAEFRLQVHAGGRVIQDQHPGVEQQGTGDGHPLLLPSGEGHAPLSDRRFVPVGKLHDEIVRLGRCGCGDDVVHGRLGPAKGNVLADRARKEGRLLKDDPDVRAQALDRRLADVDAVDGHLSFAHVVKAGNEVDDGGLA